MSERREPAEPAANRPSYRQGPWNEGSFREEPKLQAHYIARLRRLLQLRKEHLGELNREGIWLLDRSIFATYCDCVEVGAGVAAQEIVRASPPFEGTAKTPMRPPRRHHRS